MMRCAGLIAAIALASASAFAQTPAAKGVLREAISPSLSPEDAADAFDDAAINGCIASVASGMRINQAGYAANVTINENADARSQAGAAGDETVFDVIAGKGVVSVKDKPGRCSVSVYGPAASGVVMALARKLAAEEQFERLASAPSPNGYAEQLTKTASGKKLMVTIRGSEPGMPGHKSRFSVTTLTVFTMPAG
jgi:hypothetical protein